MRNRFNPLSSRWPVSRCYARPAEVALEMFQSAFIAVARLTLPESPSTRGWNSFNPLSSRWPVSLGFETLNVSKAKFQSAFIAVARLTHRTPQGGSHRRVSIRFHRGGPSHSLIRVLYPIPTLEFQSAFIAVARLTVDSDPMTWPN